MTEQSQECFEHHMCLKGKLDKIEGFLFGDTEHREQVSFVSKVNLMFNELAFIKKFLVGSVASIFCASLFIGQQLYKLDNSSTQISSYIDRSHHLELKITEMETQLANFKGNQK